jgi:hypothetical protein
MTERDTFSGFLPFAMRRHRIALGALPLSIKRAMRCDGRRETNRGHQDDARRSDHWIPDLYAKEKGIEYRVSCHDQSNADVR